MTASFFSIEMERRIPRNNRLLELNQLIRWDRVIWRLNRLDRSGLGPHGYPLLSLLKAILLGQWHSLSDEALEDSLRLRIDFILFCELQNHNSPDASTLCRFRNLLIQKNLLKKILEEINSQLEDLGLKVKISEGAILDATVIRSAARPQAQSDCEVTEETNESPTTATPTQFKSSKDPDSAWGKKGKTSYFGFKAFVVTDAVQGFIESLHVTSGNKSETPQLQTAIENLSPSRLLADKGYASKANREYLESRGIQDNILQKASPNKPLTAAQIASNKVISKDRFLVEQAFGTLKRRFKFTHASYFGIAKTTAQAQLKAICFNLTKALNLSKSRVWIPPVLA